MNFAHLNESQSKEFYQKQIKSVLNSAKSKQGFIGWHEMKYLEQGLNPIIAVAMKQFKSNNYLNAIYICTALMEEMTKAIHFSDDSNGSIGGIIHISFDMLHDMAKQDNSEEVKTELFNYCITTFNKRLFEDWDWHIGILNIAKKLIDNEEDADIILKCLDTLNGEYEKERAQSLKLDIITKYKDAKEVQRFIDKYITNPSIRNTVIKQAVNNNDFEKAIKLCTNGIEYDKKDKPGLLKKWYNWLLKIAQVQNNKTKIIEYSRYLLIDNFHPEQDYYQILKKEIEPDKWKNFLEDIIKEITQNVGWNNGRLVHTIYINEKWWDRLFLVLKENASLMNIENNEQYLSKDYSKELIQLYNENIIEFVDNHMGRKHYKTACRYLRRMKKLGGDEKVNELIAYFRMTYPKRKALLDELSSV